MANDNKNINNLVSQVDDDPTSEFQISRKTRNALPEKEVDERTFDVDRFAAGEHSEFDSAAEINRQLRQQTETIDLLQFELEKLHAKSNGLECEVRAREEIATNMRGELIAVKKQLAHARKESQERQHEIDFLQHSIRESGDAVSRATSEVEQTREATTQQINDFHKRLAERDGLLASNKQELRQLAAQVERTEKYADSLRIKLQSQQYSSQESSNSRHNLEYSLKCAQGELADVRDQLAAERKQNERLNEQIEQQQAEFDKELRQVRFELGEAQETISCRDSMNEQLASDLIENRGFRQVIESQLGELEEMSQQEIQKLERRLRAARQEADEHERKIKAKDKAIAALMNELANLANTEPTSEEEDAAIKGVDTLRSSPSGQRDGHARGRVARLLIGFAGGRELRFPLFKDRLTIGRTANNDIQLNVRYISRRHAVIVTDNGQTRLVDWGSKNGVYVNQKRVAEKFLKSGDIVTIGTTKFRYEERTKR